MEDKNKQTTIDPSSNKLIATNNSITAQRKRLINTIDQLGGLSTIQLREDHDIMQPAPRVHELRWQEGYNIQLVWTDAVNAQGNHHRCGKYILLSGKWKRGEHQ